MRRPSGPAQRTPPPAAPASVPSSAPRGESEGKPEASVLTEPIELTERIGQKKAETDATPPTASRPGSWRELRRAIGARRKVERGEARRFTARTRRRRQWQLGIAGFVVLVLGGAVLTAYSPIMSLKHIEVVGAHSVKAADVQHALAGELGTPLPLVKSADVRHALDDFRLIESYSTQLEPPSTLVVRITERTPLAVVKQGSSYEVVDQAGVVLSAGTSPQAGLPVVSLPAGQQPEHSGGFAAAAAVIAALPDAVRATVAGAGATSANNVTLTLRGGKKVVWGGTDQLDLKTADLQALLKGAPTASVYDVSSPRAPITR